MPPDPPNFLIYCVFLALTAAGPLLSKLLERPVVFFLVDFASCDSLECSLQFIFHIMWPQIPKECTAAHNTIVSMINFLNYACPSINDE